MAQHQMMNPQIVLLKDGSESAQGKRLTLHLLQAPMAIGEIVKTTLGPCGQDKLIGSTITNDGATILKLLEVAHPAARILVDIATSQDIEIGDGTTTVTVLGAAFMAQAKRLIEDGVAPEAIVRGFRQCEALTLEKLHTLSVGLTLDRDTLLKCATTALNSKLVSANKEFFGEMIVDSVMNIEAPYDLKNVGIKKVIGGSSTNSFLVDGVAFKRCFTYAGFEHQPKMFENPKILLLNVELELKKLDGNAEIRIDDVGKYQSIVEAQWSVIYEMLNQCKEVGANIVLSKLPIGDLAMQFFSDHGMFCAGRVEPEDLRRVAMATGGIIQSTTNNLTESVLGTCGHFEEVQVGAERYNLFKKCPSAKTMTMVLRGGTNQYLEETERSIHDALMIVKNTLVCERVVAGGGASEMALAKYIRDIAMKKEGKLQAIMLAYGLALEVIPRQLSINAGFDSTQIMAMLRQKHALDNETGHLYGVDIVNEGICNTFETHVWEPVRSKRTSISAATEACCLIASIDEQIINPKSQTAEEKRQKDRMAVKMAQAGMAGRNPMSAAMGGQGLRGMAAAAQGAGLRTLKGRGGK
eukprot:TRINITY_DN1219_c0_g1_i2.p1 TRINITY_DN1219_c0_g1~~TRINITY_DN1219_c0_g1_i2.p1  ORF type:complete len:581 (+),score=231.72 TRINITY_DN1219_c0_g1_i2:45-1787(+)